MSSITDLLSQVGGTVGTVGTAVAGYLATQIRSIRLSVSSAKKARDSAEAALAKVEKLHDQIETLSRGIQLQIEYLRSEREIGITRQPSQPALFDPSVPTPSELSRRMEEIGRRIEECRSDIKRERGARHAMAQALAQDAKEDERQWRDMHRLLGEIEGQITVIRGMSGQ